MQITAEIDEIVYDKYFYVIDADGIEIHNSQSSVGDVNRSGSR